MRARAIVVAIVVGGAVAGGVALAQTAQQRFEAATALEAHRQFAEARAALEQLARDAPDGSYAADALYEAAVISEERVSDPAHARDLYETVATKYPANRLARRARTRADFLAQSLATGEAPLREYDAILANAAHDGPVVARQRMEALVAKWPDFALADRALYWIAQRLAEERRWPDAIARLAELERRFPTSEWALRAKKARADILLSRGHPFAARALYRELVASTDPVARSAGHEGLADSVSWIARAIFVVVCIAYLIAFVIANLRWARRRVRTVPLELVYYLPVAGLFVAAAITENRAIGLATAGIAIGGAALVWLTSLALAARLESGPLSRRARAGRIASIVFAVMAITFIAVQATGLTDIVIETFRSGPERG